MIHFVLLIFKNLGRNKVRTTLTALAVTVLVTISAVVTTVTETVRRGVEAEASQTKLIVNERWTVPSQVPVRYIPDIAKIPGVESWTTWNLYAGFCDRSRRLDRMAIGLATRIDNLREMHVGLEGLDPSVLEALHRERTGCIVGANIMNSMGWKVGQEFTFLSTTHLGRDLRFKIVGTMPPGKWTLNFFFRDDYFREGTGNKDTVDCLWLRVPDAETGRNVAARIQRDYENQQPDLKVETESAGVARFAEKGRAILNIIQMVVAILLIDMVIILSNSISIATRERRTEMAVLKVLGFKPMHIVFMVVGEATLIGGLSGLFGATLAWGASALGEMGVIPNNAFTGFLILFPVSPATVPWGLALGAAVGALGSLWPAWSARKVKVSDVFAKIA